MAGKLTDEQRAMVEACMEEERVWLTAAGSENDDLLRGWTDLGWALPVDPPKGLEVLKCYMLTDEGRRALAAKESAQ